MLLLLLPHAQGEKSPMCEREEKEKVVEVVVVVVVVVTVKEEEEERATQHQPNRDPGGQKQKQK